MNKLMYTFVATRKKKKKKKKRNRPVFRHGMPPQGIPRNKKNMAARSVKSSLRVFKTFSRKFLRADLPSRVWPKFKGRRKTHCTTFLGVNDCYGFDGML